MVMALICRGVHASMHAAPHLTSSACGPRGAAIIIVSPDTGAASVTTAPWLLAFAAVGCLCWCPRCPLVLLLTTASTVRDGEPWNSAGIMRWRPVRPVVGLGSTCAVTGPRGYMKFGFGIPTTGSAHLPPAVHAPAAMAGTAATPRACLARRLRLPRLPVQQ